MNTADLFEMETYARLTGYLDVNGLATMLNVGNLTVFEEAITKIRLGQGGEMTIPEMSELAHAFVNLLGMDAAAKSKLIGRLFAVRAVADDGEQSTAGEGE